MRQALLRRLVARDGFRRLLVALLLVAALAGTIHAATEPLGEARKLWQAAATDIPAYNIPYRKMPTSALVERFSEADAVYFNLHDVPWENYEFDLLRLYYATCYTGFPARIRLGEGHPWNANPDDLHRQLVDPVPPPQPSEVQAVAQPRLLPDGWVLSFRETDGTAPLLGTPSETPPGTPLAAPAPDHAP